MGECKTENGSTDYFCYESAFKKLMIMRLMLFSLENCRNYLDWPINN